MSGRRNQLMAEAAGHFIDLIDIVTGKRVNKNSLGITRIIFYLSAEHVFGVADLQPDLIRIGL
jgi:hypothetical protein